MTVTAVTDCKRTSLLHKLEGINARPSVSVGWRQIQILVTNWMKAEVEGKKASYVNASTNAEREENRRQRGNAEK